MTMFQLPADALEKTKFGCVTLASFLSDFRYVKNDSSASARLEMSRGEVFVSCDGLGLPRSWKGRYGLLAKATSNSLMRWPSRDIFVQPYEIPMYQSAVKLIVWPKFNAVLALACDPNLGRDVWLGFVDLDEFKDLEIEGDPDGHECERLRADAMR